MFLCGNKRNQNSWNTYEMQKKDDTVMHYTRVNVKSLFRSAKCCIILLPFQLKTQRGNQHCCTHPETQDYIVEQCFDVRLIFGIHQYFKQLFLHSGTRKL